MNDNEAVEMMRRCSAEIKNIRAEIARLTPKAEAYDNLSALIGMFPQPSRGHGEDLAWALDRRIREIENPPKPDSDGTDGLDV